MNKKVATDPHCFICVVGPSGSGKTRFITALLRNQRDVFQPAFDRIAYFYQHEQPIYKTLAAELVREDLTFINNVDWSWINENADVTKRTLLVFDDLFDSIAKAPEFLKLVTAGRHQNLHLMVLKHNLYQQNSNSKTIDLNVTQIVLFKSPRDSNQIEFLGRQLGCRKLLLSAYLNATAEPYGHLLIDLDPRCHDYLRFASYVDGSSYSLFHNLFTTSKDITNHEFTSRVYVRSVH